MRSSLDIATIEALQTENAELRRQREAALKMASRVEQQRDEARAHLLQALRRCACIEWDDRCKDCKVAGPIARGEGEQK